MENTVLEMQNTIYHVAATNHAVLLLWLSIYLRDGHLPTSDTDSLDALHLYGVQTKKKPMYEHILVI